MKSNPKDLKRVSMESLVVPEILVTMFRSSPVNALIMDDFPTFGFPTTAMRGNPSSSSPRGSSLSKYFTTSSRISPVPEPFAAERSKTSPRPNDQNSADIPTRSLLSTLLAITRTFFFVLRKIFATVSSRSTIPVVASTTNKMTFASSIAISTCLRISPSKISSEPFT
ncbi:hypothetical protein D3C80_1458840 [compost metagenome]